MTAAEQEFLLMSNLRLSHTPGASSSSSFFFFFLPPPPLSFILSPQKSLRIARPRASLSAVYKYLTSPDRDVDADADADAGSDDNDDADNKPLVS